MNASPDPAEMTAPRDPASYAPPRRGGLGVWSFAAFGVLCVLAGAAIAHFGPALFPARPATFPFADTPPAISEAPGPARADIPLPAPAPATPQTASPAAPTAELAALADRLTELEADNARVGQAAAAALAAAALMEASQTSRPFVEEFSALEAISPPSADLGAMRRLAEVGAPSRAALAAAFPEYAARAASAARAPGEGASALARLSYAVSRVITLRRVGDVPGTGAEAVLARAERQVEDGDIDGALTTLDALTPAAQEALAPWRTRAERRGEIDRRVGAIRARALTDLARLAGRA